jgi:hypothetical protein
MFTSYVHANWKDLEKRIKLLRIYIKQTKDMDIEEENIKKYVYIVKDHIIQSRRKNKMKTRLFTKDKKFRKYRFGSDFCPNCSRFKNYEKECPFCSYHEMKL